MFSGLCVCSLCSKTIYLMELVSVDGRKFHINCFKCVECAKLLAISNFCKLSGALYCKKHYSSRISAGALPPASESSTTKMDPGSNLRGGEYDNQTLANSTFDQSSLAHSRRKSKEKPMSFLGQLDTSRKSLQYDDDDLFTNTLPEGFIGLREKLALDSGVKNALTKSVMKILGGFKGKSKCSKADCKISLDDPDSFMGMDTSNTYLNPCNDSGSLRQFSDDDQEIVQGYGSGDIFDFLALKSMKNSRALLPGDASAAGSRSLAQTANSIRTRSVECSSLASRIIPEDAYLFDDLYISLEPGLARKKQLYDQKSEISSSRLQALDSNTYLSTTALDVSAASRKPTIYYIGNIDYNNGSSCEYSRMPSARETLYEKYQNSKEDLMSILRNCPWKSEIRNICSKRNSAFMISDVFVAVEKFLQSSNSVIKFVTAYICTNVCLLNMKRAEEVLTDISDCLKNGRDFDTWQSINAINKLSASIDECWSEYEMPFTESFVISCEGYTVERPGLKRVSDKDARNLYSTFGVGYVDKCALIYRRCFSGRENTYNYIGVTSKSDYIVMSYTCITDQELVLDILDTCGVSSDFSFSNVHCAIIRRKNRRNIILLYGNKMRSNMMFLLIKCMGRSPLKVLDTYYDQFKFKKLSTDDADAKLASIDELRVSRKYKFGIIYSEPNQRTEDEILSNVKGTEKYNRLLEHLGKLVSLKGFSGYNGLLDVKSGLTGEFSLHTYAHNSEIMFHVATMLPHDDKDVQHIQKKRYIGNDIASIVYVNGKAKFDPSIIKSNFLQVFIIINDVGPNNDVNDPIFVVSVVTKFSVPPFGPPLMDPPIFTSYETLASFVINKLISGENAAYESKAFLPLYNRTRNLALDQLCNIPINKKASDPETALDAHDINGLKDVFTTVVLVNNIERQEADNSNSIDTSELKQIQYDLIS